MSELVSKLINMITFNKPFLSGKELEYIREAVSNGKISGDGSFTKRSQDFFTSRYGFQKCLLTTSCTDALEMAALLIDIKPGDEVIVPSFTFVSTANAFVLRGAKIIFADCMKEHPNIDAEKIEELITPKTKAIIPVHYSGIACEMDKIISIAKKYNLFVIEDAAQAIDSYYKGKAIGSIGNLATFSFHETKNIISGEGGMLVINDMSFTNRSEIIREKGTNRSSFYRGEVDKYNWVDIGSSFLPSEIIAAFLFAQLEKIDEIQKKRKEIWQSYYELLRPIELKGLINLPFIPDYATNNAHMFYILCNDEKTRNNLLTYLKSKDVMAVFHYLPLHLRPYYAPKHDGRALSNSEHFSNTIIRLPFFYELKKAEILYIAESIFSFFGLTL